MIPYIHLISSILLGALGQIFLKQGVNSIDQSGISFFIGTAKNLSIYAGFGCYAISFLQWLYVLKFFDISYARPFTSVGYILTYIIAIFALGEGFTPARGAGIALITAGVLVMR